MKYKSAVGWLPISTVHGMTLGELARMVNGEGWLPDGRTCDITVIPCLNYTHRTEYRLPIPPSPNLPNMKAVYLYASLCYFEATPVSLGRGRAMTTASPPAARQPPRIPPNATSCATASISAPWTKPPCGRKALT